MEHNEEIRISDDGQVHDAQRLKELQALPLDRKIQITAARITEFVERMGGVDNVVISYSGGKDSSVLLHIARQLYPTIKCVYSNTGLEYPEIQHMARINNADIIRPKMRFDEVIKTYGYPLVSKEVSEAIYYARRIRNGNNSIHNGDKTPHANEVKCKAIVQEKTENIPSEEYCDENNDTSHQCNCAGGGKEINSHNSMKHSEEEMTCSDKDDSHTHNDWNREWAFEGGGKRCQMPNKIARTHQSIQKSNLGREADMNSKDCSQWTSNQTETLNTTHTHTQFTKQWTRSRTDLLGLTTMDIQTNNENAVKFKARLNATDA